jgi:ribonuclease HII
MYKLRFKEDDEIEVGLDEAGRGCLWGRLYVGAVAFSDSLDDFPDGGEMLAQLKDSKQMTKKRRDLLFDYIQEAALAWSVSYVTAADVDRENVLQADMTAMHRALDDLSVPVGRCLVDGDYWRPYKDVEAHTLVDGDAQYLAIAAAGILAKVSRDRWVATMVAADPTLNTRYGLSTNMGYGTAAHISGLSSHGITPEHRRTFGPVGAVIGLPSRKEKAKGWKGITDA